MPAIDVADHRICTKSPVMDEMADTVATGR
jgi:hypothetical protein